MGTARFLCRVSFLDSDTAHDGQSSHYLDIIHIDKKKFSIGSGREADVHLEGDGIAPLHAEITVEAPHLFIKSLGESTTLVSAHQISSENAEPFRSGEAIRLGHSKQVVIIELFRKFVEAAEESDLIVAEANEKAKRVEVTVAEQKRELSLLQKQAEDLRLQMESQLKEGTELAKAKAEEIHQAALKMKEEIIQNSEKEAALLAQRAEKEIERTLNEIKLSSEEQKRVLMDQVRTKAKEIKQEAESEVEAFVASGRREAELLVEAAKNKVKEITEDGQREAQSLVHLKSTIQSEIGELQLARGSAQQEIQAVQADLRAVSESKNQAYRAFELEKERLRLATEDLRKNVEIEESHKRAVLAEVGTLDAQIKKMTSEIAIEKQAAENFLEKCAAEARNAVETSEKARAESEKSRNEILDLNNTISGLQINLKTITQTIAEMKSKEESDRDQIRAKLKKEYEMRLEFERQWHVKQRELETEERIKEKTAKEQIEAQRLVQQSQAISEGIQSLLGLELGVRFGDEELKNFKPQLEQLVSPIVQRCVTEEYEFRRSHWEKVRPFSFAQEMSQRANRFKRQIGVTTLSLLLLAAALVVQFVPVRKEFATHSSSQVCNTSDSGGGKKLGSEIQKMTKLSSE